MNNDKILKFITILLTTTLVSCGSYLIIDSSNYAVQTKIEKRDNREDLIRSEETTLGTYEDFQRNFIIKRTMISPFQRKSIFNIREEFAKINTRKIPLKNLNIKTKFSFWDNILGFIPFFSTRTLLIEAEYSKWEAERIRVDDLPQEDPFAEEPDEFDDQERKVELDNGF